MGKKYHYKSTDLLFGGFKGRQSSVGKPRPTPIDDMANWLDIFANGIVEHLNDAQKIRCKKEVITILTPKLYNDKNGWVLDYVRLRVKAVKV